MKDSTISTTKNNIKQTSPEPAKAARRQTETSASADKITAARAEHSSGHNKKKTFSSRLKALFKSPTFRYTLLFLSAMILLYLFSMFGSMLTSPGFTYAEF